VSLTAAIIVVVALVVILFAALALVMSRPKELRPHRPGWRGFFSSRSGTRGERPGSTG